MAKIWGIDVSRDYIIAYDGQVFYKFSLSEVSKFVSLVSSGDVIVLEQTGTYSLPWIFSLLKTKTVEVYVAHTVALKELRNFVGVSKNDVKDAELLRKLWEHKRFIYKFDENRFWLRFYFFSYRRTVKDFSVLVNRLRAFLHFVKPELAGFRVSKKGLEELKAKIERRAKKDFAYGYIYRLAEKLLLTLEDRKLLKKELYKYLVVHKDYKILKTFPHFSDLVIAGLVSTYWDIGRFKAEKVRTFSDGKMKVRKVKAVDKFRAYLLGSSRRWQSGKMDKNKKVQKRVYILGLLYPVFVQSGKKGAVLHPLWAYVREKYSLLAGYKRYYKFLGYLLEWVYLAVKNEWTFKEVIKHKIEVTLDERLREVYNQILERVKGG